MKHSFKCSFAAILPLFFTVVLNADYLWRPVENQVGNADIFGYARVSKSFDRIDFGDSNINFDLEFSTNPKYEPKMFGAFWGINLFHSTALLIKQDLLEWKSPNGTSYFFAPDHMANSKKSKPRQYLFNAGEWIAKVFDGGRISIEHGRDHFCKYDYENGRLIRFRAKKNTDIFSINYFPDGRVKSLENLSKNKKTVAFSYDSSGKNVEKMSLDGAEYTFSYSDGNLLSPDCVTTYKSNEIYLLAEVSRSGGGKDRFLYEDLSPKKRTVLFKDFSQADTPKVNIARIRFLGSSNEERGHIDWCTKTGMIVGDENGEYKVGNDVFDIYNTSGHQNGSLAHATGRPIPTFSVVEYNDRNKKYPQRFYHDWVSMIQIITNSDSGETIRKSLIGARGASYLNLRKIEKLKNESDLGKEAVWELLKTNSYDDKGRLIREMNSNGSFVERTFFDDGTLEKIITDSGVSFIKERVPDGNISTWYYMSGDIMKVHECVSEKTKTYIYNEKFFKKEFFDKNQRLVRMLKGDKEFHYTYDDAGALSILKEFSKGNLIIVKNYLNGKLESIENSRGRKLYVEEE